MFPLRGHTPPQPPAFPLLFRPPSLSESPRACICSRIAQNRFRVLLCPFCGHHSPRRLSGASEGFRERFQDNIAPGGFLEHLRASTYVFQCKHGMTAPQTCDSVQGSAWVPTAASLPSALLIVNLTTRSQRGCERLVKSGRAAFPS